MNDVNLTARSAQRTSDSGPAPRDRRMILIEFNELCPTLLDRWMGEGKLPNFRRFHDQSQVFVSSADIEDPVYLEPWIQWYSLHTGLAYDQHRVFHLTDGPAASYDDIWRVLAAAGLRVGNCMSMNARGFDAPGSYFIPDPWCTTEKARPEELETFYKVVSWNVQEYSNRDRSLGTGDYVRFLSFMLKSGLRPSTAFAIARQLVLDRVIDRRQFWRRAALLDRLQFDVFRHLQAKYRPHFATFFVNSTAHYQHAYWRHMDPSAFSLRPSEDELRTYGEAVLFGYQQMDKLIGRFLALEDGQTRLVFATALSQQPYLKFEDKGGKHFYRPRNVEALLKRLGVRWERLQSVMTHQYALHFASKQDCEDALRRLSQVKLGTEDAFGFSEVTDDSMYFGARIGRPVPRDASITFGNAPEATAPFYDVFYRIDDIKSGRHHPDGALWFKTGSHRRHADKVSILDVFPTVLDYFETARPATDVRYRGHSLAPAFVKG